MILFYVWLYVVVGVISFLFLEKNYPKETTKDFLEGFTVACIFAPVAFSMAIEEIYTKYR